MTADAVRPFPRRCHRARVTASGPSSGPVRSAPPWPGLGVPPERLGAGPTWCTPPGRAHATERSRRPRRAGRRLRDGDADGPGVLAPDRRGPLGPTAAVGALEARGVERRGRVRCTSSRRPADGMARRVGVVGHRGLEVRGGRRAQPARALTVVDVADTWCDLGELRAAARPSPTCVRGRRTRAVALLDARAGRRRVGAPAAAGTLRRRNRPRGAVALRHVLTLGCDPGVQLADGDPGAADVRRRRVPRAAR